MPSAERFSEPAKITSSDLRLRSARPCSPSDQRRASARLLLPEPFGPTTALIPGPNSTTVRSANDLNPCRRRARSRAGALTTGSRSAHGRGWIVARRGGGGPRLVRSIARLLGSERLDGPLRSGRLGDPPRRADADAERTTVDDHLDLELLLVIRPGGIDDPVLGARPGPPLGELLEPALRALQAREGRVLRD